MSEIEGQAEAPESNLWIVGVVLVLIGSLGQNLGNNLVSLAHLREHEEELSHHDRDDTQQIAVTPQTSSDSTGDVEMALIENKTFSDDTSEERVIIKTESFFYNHLWGIGTITFVTSSIMCFISFGFAAQSLLASLESIQFVSNIAFAKLVHKEIITHTMLVSTLLIVGGNALVVIFSEHNSLRLNGEEVFALYAENESFHVYLVAAAILVVTSEYTWKRYNNSRMRDRIKLWNHSFIEPFCFCVASAIIGAFAVVNAKNMSMLLASSASTDRSEFNHIQLYIIFFCWVWVVAFWVYRLDTGLDLFPPLFVIPVIQVCFVFFSIICGGVFFKEFHAFSGKQFLGFASGVALILAGVYGLAPDSDLDFSGGDDDKVSKAGSDYVEVPRRAGKRLSFASTVTSSLESVSDNTHVSSEKYSSSGKQRPGFSKNIMRRGTMAHPLAALKEIKRVGVAKAEETETFAPVLRGAVRILAASPFFVMPVDDSDQKTDASSGRYRSRTESYVKESPIAEANEEE